MRFDLDKYTLKRVQQIDLRLRRKTHSLFSGNYRSAFKGQGIIFSDVREYVPGDDIRSIAWNLTAKMSKPYVKTFEEERTAQIILAVDISASMDFGCGEGAKRDALSLLCAVIAFSAQKNKDFLGLLLFSSDVELYVPPQKGMRHCFRVIRDISCFKRQSNQTDMEKSFSFLQKVLRKKSHIFIFSDFLTRSPFEKAIQRLARKHDVIPFLLSDSLEREIPPLGLVDVHDMETGERMVVDFSSPISQRQLKNSMAKKIKERDRQLVSCRSESIFIDCQKDIYQPLIRFFQTRSQRRHFF